MPPAELGVWAHADFWAFDSMRRGPTPQALLPRSSHDRVGHSACHMTGGHVLRGGIDVAGLIVKEKSGSNSRRNSLLGKPPRNIASSTSMFQFISVRIARSCAGALRAVSSGGCPRERMPGLPAHPGTGADTGAMRSEIVTGPSLTRCTCMSAANCPVCTIACAALACVTK